MTCPMCGPAPRLGLGEVRFGCFKLDECCETCKGNILESEREYAAGNYKELHEAFKEIRESMEAKKLYFKTGDLISPEEHVDDFKAQFKSEDEIVEHKNSKTGWVEKWQLVLQGCEKVFYQFHGYLPRFVVVDENDCQVDEWLDKKEDAIACARENCLDMGETSAEIWQIDLIEDISKYFGMPEAKDVLRIIFCNENVDRFFMPEDEDYLIEEPTSDDLKEFVEEIDEFLIEWIEQRPKFRNLMYESKLVETVEVEIKEEEDEEEDK